MSKGNILSPKEEIIMSCIWMHGPLRVKEIIELMPDPKPHFNTVSTFVRGLQAKGWLTHSRTKNIHSYEAAVSLDAYRDSTLERIATLFFDNDPDKMIEYLKVKSKKDRQESN